jgi:hypothetical protein
MGRNKTSSTVRTAHQAIITTSSTIYIHAPVSNYQHNISRRRHHRPSTHVPLPHRTHLNDPTDLQHQHHARHLTTPQPDINTTPHLHRHHSTPYAPSHTTTTHRPPSTPPAPLLRNLTSFPTNLMSAMHVFSIPDFAYLC